MLQLVALEWQRFEANESERKKDIQWESRCRYVSEQPVELSSLLRSPELVCGPVLGGEATCRGAGDLAL